MRCYRIVVSTEINRWEKPLIFVGEGGKNNMRKRGPPGYSTVMRAQLMGTTASFPNAGGSPALMFLGSPFTHHSIFQWMMGPGASDGLQRAAEVWRDDRGGKRTQPQDDNN